MVVVVLALQGDFAEHINILHQLDVDSLEVRTIDQLEQCDALIIPGGESTVMWKLLTETGIDQVIIKKAREGMPILGTCAGAIVLSDSHLNLIDITVERNAYGSQLQSFTDRISIENIGEIEAIFIRAPLITRAGDDVSILAHHKENPVFVHKGDILVATFHPELQESCCIHKYFLSEVACCSIEA